MNGFAVTDAAGHVLRSGRSRHPADQLGADGVAVFVLEEWDGQPINDAEVKIVDGAFVPIDPHVGPMPNATLAPVEES